MREVERRFPLRSQLPVEFSQRPYSLGYFADFYTTACRDVLERVRIGGVFSGSVLTGDLYPVAQFTRKVLTGDGEYEETDRTYRQVVSNLPGLIKVFRPEVIVTGVRRQYRRGKFAVCIDKVQRWKSHCGIYFPRPMGDWVEIERMANPWEVSEALSGVQKYALDLFGVKPENLIKDPYPLLENTQV